MKNKSYRHKQSVVAWIIMAIGLFMLCATLAGLCMQLFGKGKYKPSEWLIKQEQSDAYSENNDEPTGGGLSLPSKVENNGIILTSSHIAVDDYEDYDISAQADTAYILTASVWPEIADNRNIVVSVGFANPSSAWASGKTVEDYVTATIGDCDTISGIWQIRVECFAAFGEQIVVTVASESDPAVTATCTCDYLQRPLDVTLDFFGEDILPSLHKSVQKSYGFSRTGVSTSFCSWNEDIILNAWGLTGYWSGAPHTKSVTYTYTVYWKYSDGWFGSSYSDFLSEKAGTNGVWNTLGTLTLGGRRNLGAAGFPFQLGRYLGVCKSSYIDNVNVSNSYLRYSAGGSVVRNDLKTHYIYQSYPLEFRLLCENSDFDMSFEYYGAVGLLEDSLKTSAETVALGQSSFFF